MKPLLSFGERASLIAKINNGWITRQELADMQLAPSDEEMLTWYLPRVAVTGTPLGTPDRLKRIAADVQDKVAGQPLRDPVGFLMDGKEDDVKRLIDDDSDWRYIEQERLKRNNQRKDGDSSEEN